MVEIAEKMYTVRYNILVVYSTIHSPLQLLKVKYVRSYLDI